AGVAREAVELVEEERARALDQERVDVLEHHDAGRLAARTVEHRFDRLLGRAMPSSEALDVETRQPELAYQRLHAQRLAVAGRSEKQRAAPPRDPGLVVGRARREELLEVVADLLLEVPLEHELIEARGLDRVVELRALGEAALGERQDLAAHVVVPLRQRREEGLGAIAVRSDDVMTDHRMK